MGTSQPTLKRQTSQSQHQNGHVRSQSLQNENSEPQYETMSPQPCVLKPFKPESSSLPNNDYWNIFLQKTTCTGKSAKLKTGNLSGMCCSTQSNIPAPQNNQALHKKARTISSKNEAIRDLHQNIKALEPLKTFFDAEQKTNTRNACPPPVSSA